MAFAFDFEALDHLFTSDSVEEHIAESAPPRWSSARRAREPAEWSLHIMSLSGETIAHLQEPASTSGGALKQLLGARLGLDQEEVRLVVGSRVVADKELLREVASPGECPLRVTLVHVPGPARVALSGCCDGMVKLWNVDGADEMMEFAAHHGAVTCVDLNWPSRRAATGGEDGCINLWDVRAGKCQGQLRQDGDCAVNCLAMDWAGQRILTGSADAFLRIWDVKRFACVAVLAGHTDAILCASCDWARMWAATGSADCTIRLWDLEARETLQEIAMHRTPIQCIAADCAERLALAGSFAILRVWDLGGYSWYSDLVGHPGAVTSVAVDWQRRQALSAGSDGAVRLWRAPKEAPGAPFRTAGKPLLCKQVLHGHDRAVTCVAAAWREGWAVSGDEGGKLLVWDLESPETEARWLPGHGKAVFCVAVSSSKPSPRAGASQ